MPGYGVSKEEMEKIYEKVKDKGDIGLDRNDFLELIRPLKRSVEALLKMMECNGFLLYEDCKEFRIYAFSIAVIEEYEEEELKKLRIQHYADTRSFQARLIKENPGEEHATGDRQADQDREGHRTEDCGT